jgi:hypothetical protein
MTTTPPPANEDPRRRGTRNAEIHNAHPQEPPQQPLAGVNIAVVDGDQQPSHFLFRFLRHEKQKSEKS